MTDFVEIFRDEVEVNLKEATRLTLALEAGEPERAHIEALMRVFHSLKGAARAMQFDAERETAHLLEDVYHDLLAGEARYRPALIDLSLQAIDLFREQVKARLAEQTLPDAAALRERMGRYRAGEPIARDQATTGEQAAVLAGDELAEAPPGASAPARDRAGALGNAPAPDVPEPPQAPGGAALFSVFHAEAQGYLGEVSGLLEGLTGEPPDAEGLAALQRSFRLLKGAARAIGLADVCEVAGSIEALLVDVGDGRLPARPALEPLLRCALRWIELLVSDGAAGTSAPSVEPLCEQVAGYRRGETEDECGAPVAGRAPQGAPLASVGEMQGGGVARSAATGVAGTGTESRAGSPIAGVGEVSAPRSASERPPGASRPAPRRRTSLAYEQLDRLHRLSGELTVSVGALAGQRNRIRRLARELDQASRQLGRLNAAQRGAYEPGGGAEGLHELLRPVIERLAAIGGGLEALNQVHDRTEGQLQQLVEHLADEVTQARLVPLTELLDDYPRIVRDLARDLGKQVVLHIDGDQNRIDRAVLEGLRNPLLHLVRNALDHGIESPVERRALGKPEHGCLGIEAQQLGSMMRIRVADDGGGIDLECLRETVVSSGRTTENLWQAMGVEEQLQFLFLPGLSTTASVSDTSGRGFGLDIVKSALDAMGGRVGVHSERGQGCHVELQVPLSLALTRCLLVRGGRHPLFGVQRYAIPMPEVVSVMRLDPARLRRVEGRPAVHLDDETLPLYELSQLLGLTPLTTESAEKHLLILGDHERRAAVLVEAVIDELDLVTRPLDERLGKVQQAAGVTLLDDGGLALVLDVPDLLEHPDEGAVQPREAPPEPPARVSHILVVEDSVTVREVERHFLTQAGYAVTTAVNGVDGLNKAKAGAYDMLITDIDMPRMNGIELIRTLRGIERFRRLPVIVVSYKDRPEDREAALSAGASHYVTKAEFDTDAMLASVAELLAGAGGHEAPQGPGR